MELAAFKRLEEQIDRLLGKLETLKSANQRLTQKVESQAGEINELKELISSREAQREQVRDRIEMLIGKLESFEDVGGEEGQG